MQPPRPFSAQFAQVHRRRQAHRRGLAPLELVLALPLLLFVMALMINLGTQGCWKVRSLTAARSAVWRDRYPRTGGSDPRPLGWPQQGSMSVAPERSPQPDPFAGFPVVRGPSVVVDGGYALRVEASVLDYFQKQTEGRADLSVPLPLLPGLGPVRFRPRHLLLENRWQFAEMGLGDNVVRRSPVLYPELADRVFFQRAPDELADYRETMQRLLSAPWKPSLFPLDRDQEFIEYYGAGDPDYLPPDFHPRIRTCSVLGPRSEHPQPRCGACLLDPDRVQREFIDAVNCSTCLIPRIVGPRGGGAGGVPARIANAFLNMYRQQLNDLQAATPNSPGAAPLQEKIRQLEEFLQTLN